MKKITGILIFLLMASCHLSLAQNRQVSGIVSSAEDNTPIIGVTVLVVGSNTGALTDHEGRYSINVPAGAEKLEFAHVAFKTVEIPLTASSVLNVSMTPTMVNLDEVVVVAYGTARKSSLTGSTSSIDSRKLSNRPLTNAVTALEGVAAGLQVNNDFGAAGTDPTIRIRGIGSVNASSSPLYVVDGVPYTAGISSINAADIETITVLKDASSSALFGSRAANGVIMITTKSGKSEKNVFRATITQGFVQRGQKEYETMDAYEYVPTIWESYRNGLVTNGTAVATASATASSNIISSSGGNILRYNIFNVPNNELVLSDGTLNPNAKIREGFLGDLNWFDPIERNGYRQNYDMSASGGTSKANYYTSIGYVNEQDFIIKSGLERFTGRTNVNITPASWFSTGLNLTGTIRNFSNLTATVDDNAAYINPFYFARNMGPIYPVHVHDMTTGELVRDKNGNLIYDTGSGFSAYGVPTRPQAGGRHIAQEIEENTDRTRLTTLTAQAYGEISFLKDFKFRVNATIESTGSYNKSYDNKNVGDGAPEGRASRMQRNYNTYTFNQLLTYDRSFGLHNLDVLIGHENYEYRYSYFYSMKQGQVAVGNDELINFLNTNSNTSYSTLHRIESYLSRARYNYDGKYFVDASFRTDGSSKFHKDKRWGNFWSLGASWLISSENFMQGLKWIDRLKLRSSYGQVGNDSGIDIYAFQPLYGIIQGGNAGSPALIKSALGNYDLKWESSNTFDVALEFRLWNRFNASFEFFNRQSSNLLFNVALAASVGATVTDNANNPAPRTLNIGTMYNRGVEISMDVDAVRTKDWTWNIGVNLTHYKNRITKMPEENRADGLINGSKKLMEGHSIYDFWLRDWVGVAPDNGDPLYILDEDANTYNEGSSYRDRTINGIRYTTNYTRARFSYHGSAIGDLWGSLNNTVRWKNLDLAFLITFQIGGKVFDGSYQTLMTSAATTGQGTARHKDLLKRWRKEGDVTDVPRVDNVRYNDMTGGNSSRWLVDGSYLNFRSVSIGYNFPKSITDKLSIGDLRVYASGENLGYLNKRKGMSPQQSFNGTSNNSFVRSRIFSLGLNFTL